mmetsp:Transcript_26959/g.47571  ORF Transcript_26959/g.47571 Transcript_26959/m.47571 type:complete len:257 (-) Transcript_26959:60-830(-)
MAPIAAFLAYSNPEVSMSDFEYVPTTNRENCCLASGALTPSAAARYKSRRPAGSTFHSSNMAVRRDGSIHFPSTDVLASNIDGWREAPSRIILTKSSTFSAGSDLILYRVANKETSFVEDGLSLLLARTMASARSFNNCLLLPSLTRSNNAARREMADTPSSSRATRAAMAPDSATIVLINCAASPLPMQASQSWTKLGRTEPGAADSASSFTRRSSASSATLTRAEDAIGDISVFNLKNTTLTGLSCRFQRARGR